jgi:preprotein translocase subunit SecA
MKARFKRFSPDTMSALAAISQAQRAQRARAAAKRREKRTLEAGYLWVELGGGTSLTGGNRYPSDSQWINLKTGETVTVTCTTATYFDAIPKLRGRIRSLREITRLPGIGKITRRPAVRF